MNPTRLCYDTGLWDDEPLSRAEVEDAICQMHDLLVMRFRSLDLNCLSPIALGHHLLAACWHKDNMKVPAAPPEVQELLKATSPQGRHEILTLPHLETIPALYEYDMRLAYLWCCKGLPYGDYQHTSLGHKQYVRWSAPEGWNAIGLLPMRTQGWSYPLQGDGWIDQREYALANRMGWQLHPMGDGLLWSKEGALDRWSDGMQWALRQVQEGGLVYRMLRRVALHTIGSLHRTTHTITHTRLTPPAGNASARYDTETNLYTWQEEQPIKGRGTIYCHPEWTTTIWARCRARIAQAALSVPREELIAIRQDALYTTTKQEQWTRHPEIRHIGSIRCKWSREGPLPAPQTLEDLDRLRKGHYL